MWFSGQLGRVGEWGQILEQRKLPRDVEIYAGYLCGRALPGASDSIDVGAGGKRRVIVPERK